MKEEIELDEEDLEVVSKTIATIVKNSNGVLNLVIENDYNFSEVGIPINVKIKKELLKLLEDNLNGEFAEEFDDSINVALEEIKSSDIMKKTTKSAYSHNFYKTVASASKSLIKNNPEIKDTYNTLLNKGFSPEQGEELIGRGFQTYTWIASKSIENKRKLNPVKLHKWIFNNIKESDEKWLNEIENMNYEDWYNKFLYQFAE